MSDEHYYPDLFGFKPSTGLAVAAIVCFSLVTIALFVLTVKFRKWYFMVAVIAGAVEVVGYGTRIMSADDPHQLGLYITTTLLILLPPTALAAVFLFANLGKIMKKTGISHPIFKPNVVKYLFLGVDIFSIIVQGAGGALLSQTVDKPDLATTAKAVMLLGLCVALCSFTLFFFLIIYLHLKVLKIKDEEDKKWRIIFYALYASALLIILRSIYRVAEYAGGYHSAIMLNEGLFYGLDALAIFILMCIWCPFHPGFVVISNKKNKSKGDIESSTTTRGGVEME